MAGWTVVPNGDTSAWKPVAAAPPAQPEDWRDKYTTLEPHGTQHTGVAPVDAGITALSNIGAGGLGAILHPVKTLEGIGHAIAHPIDTAEATASQLFNPDGTLAPHAAENAEGMLGQAATLGAAGEGAGAAVAAGGRAIAPTMSAAAQRLYGSALKPSTTLDPAARAGIIQTGLKGAIPVSQSGLESLGGQIDALNQAIKGAIDADPNRPIDPNAVAGRIQPTLSKFSNQVVAQPDLNAIQDTRQQFLAEQGAKPGKPAIAPAPTGLLDQNGRPIMSSGTPAQPPTPAPPMNAADAQAMKQGTYQVLRGKYGEQGSATVEAQKALARGLKEEIAGQFPEIDALNAQESKLLDLQPLLERAVNRISNRNIIGIGTPIAGGAAKAVTGSTPLGIVATVLKAAVDDPMVKSRLAIALSKGARVPYATALSRIQAYSSGLGATAGAVQGSSPVASQGQSGSGQP